MHPRAVITNDLHQCVLLRAPLLSFQDGPQSFELQTSQTAECDVLDAIVRHLTICPRLLHFTHEQARVG